MCTEKEGSYDKQYARGECHLAVEQSSKEKQTGQQNNQGGLLLSAVPKTRKPYLVIVNAGYQPQELEHCGAVRNKADVALATWLVMCMQSTDYKPFSRLTRFEYCFSSAQQRKVHLACHPTALLLQPAAMNQWSEVR